MITDRDLYWLAGLLEGEGSFLKGPPPRPNSPAVSCQMTDEDIICRVAKIVGVKYHRVARRNKRWKPAFSVKLNGDRAIALMKRLRSLMGLRRQKQIDDAINSFDVSVSSRKLSYDDILDIKTRLLSGETQRSIAESHGVDRSTIGHIKSGRIHGRCSSEEECRSVTPEARVRFPSSTPQ